MLIKGGTISNSNHAKVDYLAPLIHLGGPKTGSTSLQNGFFKSLPSSYFFGEFGDGVTTAEDSLAIQKILENDETFVDSKIRQKLFEKHFKIANGRNMIFSSADVLVFNRPSQISSILLEEFGRESRILLIVRNQFSALSSFYTGHGAWHKPAPSKFYRRYVDPNDWLRFQFIETKTSILKTFLYFAQIEPFINKFGLENVHCFCFEDLIAGDFETWSKIEKLTDSPAGNGYRSFSERSDRIGFTTFQFLIFRFYTRFLRLGTNPKNFDRYNLNSIGKNFGKKHHPKFDDELLERINSFYSSDNVLLNSIFKLNLARHRYPN